MIAVSDDLAMIVATVKLKELNREKLHRVFEDQKDLVIIDKKYMTSGFIDNLKNDFDVLVSLSLIVVFIILLISFGRFELAVITIMPVLIKQTDKYHNNYHGDSNSQHYIAF